MTYNDKLNKALQFNKTNAIVFYGIRYNKGDLIEFERIMTDERLLRKPGDRW